jgi:hypothetical protein
MPVKEEKKKILHSRPWEIKDLCQES